MLATDVIGDLLVVLAVSWLAGALARRVGQPAVVGQILAGIAVGPSVLGRLPWHLTGRLFPAAAVPSLAVLAQIAVVVFMFIVGLEIDLPALRARSRAAAAVAIAAVTVPLGLGAGLALLADGMFTRLGQPPASHPFVLFMGIALTVTALPVLAAVARERGIAATTAGITATAAAGLMDVAAWLLLAAALVGTRPRSVLPWPVTLALIPCFFAAMLLAVRPAAARWLAAAARPLPRQLAAALLLVFGSAWITAQLGLDPIFGGLLAGLTMSGTGSDSGHAATATGPAFVPPLAGLGQLLLPVFFTVTGLSLNLGSLHADAWAVLAVCCLLGATGKLGPAYAAGRLGGLGHRDAATVAALVNTRGLTELIVLNAAHSAGLLKDQLYAVLVLMALILTVATAPMLALIRPVRSPAAQSMPRAFTPIELPRAIATTKAVVSR